MEHGDTAVCEARREEMAAPARYQAWLAPVPAPVMPARRERARARQTPAAAAPVGDPCELFRRAIVEGDQGAWEALCARYQGLIRAWLRRHPAASLVDEAEDYLVNRTFERFWRSIGPDRFGAFEGLQPLLGYLKLCAQSVLLDESRARAKHQSVRLVGRERAASFEDAVAERAAARTLWDAISAAVRDESELLVARLSFIQGLKPGEIREHYPERYADIADVYRIKRNLLERLRRDATILSAYAEVASARANQPARQPDHAGVLNARGDQG